MKINGVDTPSMLTHLMTVARADGANDAKRIALLGVRGDDKYEAFDMFYPLFFPAANSKLRLAVRKPGEDRLRMVETEALTPEQRLAPIKEREDSLRGGQDASSSGNILATVRRICACRVVRSMTASGIGKGGSSSISTNSRKEMLQH